MKCTFFFFIFSGSFIISNAQTRSIVVSSPDKKIVVSCNPAKAVYSINYKGQTVLADSKLGVVREGFFSKFEGDKSICSCNRKG